MISLLRSVLSACRGGSFGVAPHALASCHFSPRSPRGHGEAWRFKSLSPALQEGLPRGPCHVPAPPVCLQLVVTSTSTERAATPPALSLGRRQARGRSQPTLFLIVVKYRKHRFSVLLPLPSPILKAFPGGSEVKASACNAGDLGSIPGSGRSPGEGNGNPLQYSCPENPMDRWMSLVGYSPWTDG